MLTSRVVADAVVIFCLVAAASAFGGKLQASEQVKEKSLLRSWEQDLDADTKKTPIQRVVELLKQMKAQLEKEKEEDEELYDQMVCWCETNDKESTKAIADAQAKITDLTAEIAERAGRGAELQTQIEQLEKEIAEAKEALAKATALREKEYAEFTSEEKDMMQAVTNLKNAIIILGKHNTGLLQASPALVQSMGTVLRDAAARRDLILAEHGKDEAKQDTNALNTMFLSLDAKNEKSGKDEKKKGAAAAFTEIGFLKSLRSALKQEDRPDEEIKVELPAQIAGEVLAQFAKGSGAFLQAQKGEVPAYTPSSGVIFGILKQMKEEFESEMSENQKAEMQAQADFADLKKTKEAQIAAGEKAVDEKSAEMADNGKKLADAKEDLQLTNDSLNEDQKFLVNLKLTCQALDKEWATRSKARNTEIEAVSEALAMLTEDDARELMAKTVTFLQASSSTSFVVSMQMRRAQALRVVKAAAKNIQPADDWTDNDLVSIWHSSQGTPSAQLSAMAVSVQLDAFTKVKAAIDDMVAELKAQQEEEVKHKAFCNGEFNDNERITFEKTKQKEDQEAKIEDLTSTIETLTKEIAEAKSQIANLQVEIKRAGENREKENADFQTTVADQRATQAILNKVKARLAKVYGKSALIQLEGREATAQEPPVKFAKMKKNAGGSGVMSFLDMIINDSKTVETEALEAEQKAQKAYETFVNDSNDTINQLSDAITAKTEEKAQADMDKESTTTALGNTNGELEQLAAEKADLHEQCDFVLKNFDIRQQARLQEIEALQQVKGILSGSMAGADA